MIVYNIIIYNITLYSNIYSIPTMAEDSDALTAEFQVVLTQNTLINNIN